MRATTPAARVARRQSCSASLKKEGAANKPAFASIASITRQLHIDTAALRLGSSVVAVRYSLDGGPFRRVSWQASADGGGLDLLAERAIAFLTELYGKTELRLAIVRPLSVPLLLTFAVGGAEQSLGTIAERCQWSAAPAISEVGRWMKNAFGSALCRRP